MNIAYRHRKQELLATVVNVQLSTNNFEDYSHQAKLECVTFNTKEIYIKGIPIRLIGVRVDKLVDKEEVQLSLFGNTENDKKTRRIR